MAFTVEDFQDLVRVLEQRPEWRAELRRLLLPDEVLALPQLVRELTEAQVRAEERLSRVEEGLGRLEQVLGEVAQAQLRLEQVVGELAQAQLRTEQALGSLTVSTNALRGDVLELRYSRHANGYFGTILRRIRVLGDDELWALLEEAIDQGQLSHPEARDLALADIVARGRSLVDGSEEYLVVEVSWTIDYDDVERAIRRAERLGRTGRRVRPVVAGTVLRPPVSDDAHVAGVWCVTDGQVVGPGDG